MSVCHGLLFSGCGRLVVEGSSNTIYHARLDVLALWRKIGLHDQGDTQCKDAATSVFRMARPTRGTRLGAS